MTAILSFVTWVSRFVNEEYSLIFHKKNAVQWPGPDVQRKWDIAIATNSIDLDDPIMDQFKQVLIKDNVLTSARADVIFSRDGTSTEPPASLEDALAAMFAPIVTGAYLNPSIGDMIGFPGMALCQMQATNGANTTMAPPPDWTIMSEALNDVTTSGYWTIDLYGNIIPSATTPPLLSVNDTAVVTMRATNAFGFGDGVCSMTFQA
jgi:hypothetical protein